MLRTTITHRLTGATNRIFRSPYRASALCLSEGLLIPLVDARAFLVAFIGYETRARLNLASPLETATFVLGEIFSCSYESCRLSGFVNHVKSPRRIWFSSSIEVHLTPRGCIVPQGAILASLVYQVFSALFLRGRQEPVKKSFSLS